MKTQLLVYTANITTRLQYVVDWMCQQLGIQHQITTRKETAEEFSGAVIVYHEKNELSGALHIKPHGLLSETDIHTLQLSINRWKKSTVLFYNQPGGSVPFDIFSAVFFLISRYEEYLPHTKDKHGRFQAQDSVAFKYAFLKSPVVDEWIFHFGQVLLKQFDISVPHKNFAFIPSYDLDLAWKYLHKGFSRTVGGYVKDLLRLRFTALWNRSATLLGLKKDSFQNFGALQKLHEQYNIKPLLFVLLGQHSAYDKNTDPSLRAMQHLIQSLSKQYDIGIHPSYLANDNLDLIEKEISLLKNITKLGINTGRMHFIKFDLPDTYQLLLDAGIRRDYSMGYATHNGFRAGTSNAFPWYNLASERVTDLIVQPFAFMDATSVFYLKQSNKEIYTEWLLLWQSVKKVNGTFVSIAHNHILGNFNSKNSLASVYKRIWLDFVSSYKSPA